MSVTLSIDPTNHVLEFYEGNAMTWGNSVFRTSHYWNTKLYLLIYTINQITRFERLRIMLINAELNIIF